ncbi:hypothetical protein EMIHUDRAFT_456302, partial [Emiliania huxleyi CCMP1516]|uniref:Uncharacterized protein n=2 Tax=Emiliania huxleyi TaxID=2903 RepID=A0A0D3K6S7_EMIH1
PPLLRLAAQADSARLGQRLVARRRLAQAVDVPPRRQARPAAPLPRRVRLLQRHARRLHGPRRALPGRRRGAARGIPRRRLRLRLAPALLDRAPALPGGGGPALPASARSRPLPLPQLGHVGRARRRRARAAADAGGRASRRVAARAARRLPQLGAAHCARFADAARLRRQRPDRVRLPLRLAAPRACAAAVGRQARHAAPAAQRPLRVAPRRRARRRRRALRVARDVSRPDFPTRERRHRPSQLDLLGRRSSL